MQRLGFSRLQTPLDVGGGSAAIGRKKLFFLAPAQVSPFSPFASCSEVIKGLKQ